MPDPETQKWDDLFSASPVKLSETSNKSDLGASKKLWLTAGALSLVVGLVLVILRPPIVRSRKDQSDLGELDFLKLLVWSVLPAMIYLIIYFFRRHKTSFSSLFKK